MHTSIRNFFKRSLMTLALTFILLPAGLAQAELKVGDVVEAVDLFDEHNKPAQIPDLGKKALLILYADTTAADINDKFADRVKALSLPSAHFRSMGIVNMKESTGILDSLIRAVVRGKIKKYNVTILCDPELILKAKWSLGETDNKSVVILLDANRKVRYIHTNKTKKEELVGAEQDEAVKIVQQVVSEQSGGSYQPQPSPTRN